VGQNLSPQFTLDGEEILFISEKRQAHRHPQLYAIDLGTFQERRLTFQDGHVFDAIAFSENEVSYSSTTDEYKERPLLFYPEMAKQPFPSTEIYLANIQGVSIERLTQEAGFDGFIHRHPLRPDSILFSKWHQGHLQLWQLNTKTKARILLRSVKDRSVSNAHFSPLLKKWLWMETLAGGDTEIWTGNSQFQKSERLNLPFAKLKDAQWIPDQVKISFLMSKENKTEALFWDIENQCLGSLFTHDDLIHSLVWSPNKTHLAMGAVDDNQLNIYLRTMNTAELNCPAPTPVMESKN
jgi:WD40 repeat protein